VIGSEIPEGFDLQARQFLEEMRARTADDTVADDTVEGFLDALDEAMWILDRAGEVEETAFAHARRQADHVGELRRILYRLHLVLADWQEVSDGS
jgi:hypothetical protein